MTNLAPGVFDRRARCIPEHQLTLVQELLHFKANIAVIDDNFVIIIHLCVWQLSV